MKNTLDQSSSTKSRQNTNFVGIFSTISTTVGLILSLLITTPAQAKKPVTYETFNNTPISYLSKTDFIKIKARLILAGLGEEQINEIEGLYKKIEEEKAKGELPKDFEMRVYNELINKELISRVPTHTDKLWLPSKINEDNFIEIYGVLFDKEKTKKSLLLNKNLTKKEKQEIIDEFGDVSHYYLMATIGCINEYGETYKNELFDLFNRLAPKLKYKNIINYQKLYAEVFVLAGIRYNPELKKSDIENYYNIFALRISLLLSGGNTKYVAIYFTGANMSGQKEDEEMPVIILGNNGQELGINTEKMIQDLLNMQEQIKQEYKKRNQE